MNDVNALQPKKNNNNVFLVDMSRLCTQHVHVNRSEGNLSNSIFIYVLKKNVT